MLEKPENLGKVALSDTKMPILCLKCQKMGVSKGESAQKWQFRARGEGENGIGKRKGEAVTLNVTFLQITAQAFRMQIPHNQIINF